MNRKYKHPDHKPDFHSKTLWVNILIGIIASSSAIVNEGEVNPEMARLLLLFGVISNLVLRYITNKSIEPLWYRFKS